MKKYKISLCMITKDEEHFLPRCLDSVKDIVDEIIIVDTGSTDKTVEIAKKYGANVSGFKWCDDFSKARNAGLDLATGDFILHLDADEEFFAEDKELFRKTLSADTLGYGMQIIDNNTKGNSIAVRAWKNDPTIRFAGRIHEQPAMGGDYTLGGSTLLTNFRILHYGYAQDIFKQRDKNERNKRILLEELRQHPESELDLYYFAVYQANTGKINTAIHILLNIYEKQGQFEHSEVARFLAKSLIRVKSHEKALTFLKKAQEKFPGYTDLYFLEGINRMAMNDITGAEAAFKECLRRGPAPLIYFSDPRDTVFMPTMQLALIYGQTGRPELAIEHFIKAIRAEPEDAKARTAFLGYLRMIAPDRAENLFEKVMEEAGLQRFLPDKNP